MEVLVVIAIIGVLIGVLLPAVQAAREAARRMQCHNRLHQIGIAIHNYHASFNMFPPGGWQVRPTVSNGKQFAWSAMILPFMEEPGVYELIDFDYAFDHSVNEPAAESVVQTYLCPSTPTSARDSGEGRSQDRGATDYGGIYGERITSANDPPRGFFIHETSLRFRDCLDGTSNTIAVGEDAAFRDGQWINAWNLFDQAFSINRAPKFENDLRSFHPQGVNILYADGSVTFLNDSIDIEILAALCTRNGNENIPQLQP